MLKLYPMQKSYNAVNGQSIYDVCLNTYGTLDLLVKQLVDSGGTQGVNDVPASGQVYVYDDDLVVDQAVNQAYLLTSVRYATVNGTNGQTYYIINQNPAVPVPVAGNPGPPVTPPNPATMLTQVNGTSFTSGADGTAIITPFDKDGNSMIGCDIVQIEKEIKPIINANWVWNKNSGILTLINGETVDLDQTLFIIYSKQVNA
jgi:hypothetical protein